jgi:hypothetical protein
MRNRQLLDDLEEGDIIEMDLGQMKVKGNYLCLHRMECGKWSICIKRSSGKDELVLAEDIQSIKRVR